MFIVIFFYLDYQKCLRSQNYEQKIKNKIKYKHKCDTLYKNSKVLTDLAYIWLFIEKIAQHITNIEHQ